MITANAKWVVAIAAVLAIAGFASAQQPPPTSAQQMGEFDCVVEAKMMIKLGSPDTGLIDSLKVDRDTTIKKGDVLAELDSNLQRIALELAQLKASNEGDINSERTRLAYRNAEAERAETLHSKQIATTKVRDEAVTEKNLVVLALAKAELEHKMAQVEMEQAQARLDRRSVRSPVNGVVSDVTIRPGEYVYEQTPLMTIAEIDPLYVKVFVPVRYYRQVRVGTNAEVMPEEPIGGLYKAQVTVVDRVFDTASSTFGVRLELPNPNYTLPAGMRCRIRFLAQETLR
jgi:RND family efflux transporter MFP subunit